MQSPVPLLDIIRDIFADFWSSRPWRGATWWRATTWRATSCRPEGRYRQGCIYSDADGDEFCNGRLPIWSPVAALMGGCHMAPYHSCVPRGAMRGLLTVRRIIIPLSWWSLWWSWWSWWSSCVIPGAILWICDRRLIPPEGGFRHVWRHPWRKAEISMIDRRGEGAKLRRG